jgi:hypothetical protein
MLCGRMQCNHDGNHSVRADTALAAGFSGWTRIMRNKESAGAMQHIQAARRPCS